jgi:hypothetical protein
MMVISADGKYRYYLRRTISGGSRIAAFIMLNSSTADAQADDPTIRKCIGICRLWGYGELHGVNLFALPGISRSSRRAMIRPALAGGGRCR